MLLICTVDLLTPTPGFWTTGDGRIPFTVLFSFGWNRDIRFCDGWRRSWTNLDPFDVVCVGATRRFLEYRSAIFYHSPEQKEIAQKVTEEVQEKYFTPQGKNIVTQIVEAGKWWDAEK